MCLARPEGFEPPTFWSVATKTRFKKANKIKDFSIKRSAFCPLFMFIMYGSSPS